MNVKLSVGRKKYEKIDTVIEFMSQSVHKT